MNILFVTSEFPVTRTSPTGGIGTYLLNLATQLRKSKHNVYVVTRKEKKRYRHKGIKIIDIDCRIFKRHIKDLSIVGKLVSFLEYPVIFSIKTAFSLNKIIKKNNIDIIEGNDFGGDLWLYFINPFFKKTKPVVLRLHTPYFLIRKYNNVQINFASTIISFFEKISIKHANIIYSPTRSLARIITNKTGRKVNTIIPYPFPVQKFNLLRNNRKKDTVLFVGKLQYKKGVFKLLSIVREIKIINKNIFCYIIGPDTIFENLTVSGLLKKKAKEYSLLENVKIINKVIGKKKLVNYYKKSTVLVVPSLWENFPNVILEAFLTGTPVVASSVGGIPEMIIDGYNGLLYKANSEKSSVNAILNILKNPKLARRLVINANKTLIQKYSAEKVLSLTVAFYQGVIKNFNK